MQYGTKMAVFIRPGFLLVFTLKSALALFRLLLIATLLAAFPSWGITSQIASDYGSQVKLTGGDGYLPSAAAEPPDNSQDDDSHALASTNRNDYAATSETRLPEPGAAAGHPDHIKPPARAPPAVTTSHAST